MYLENNYVIYNEWEMYIIDNFLKLVNEKWIENITIDDIKNIWIDLMNKWNCDNSNKVYISLRDKMLLPLINDLISKQE